MIENKKAAMEMSVGTIVTIVLLMSVLVLGLVLITNIFSGATSSVKTIDDKVKSEINNIFKDNTAILAISPSDKKVKIAQGAQAEGFAFAVNNQNTEAVQLNYKVYVDPRYDLTRQCGQITTREVESWLITNADSLNIPRSSKSQTVLILFNIPKTAPICTIPYTLDVMNKGELYVEDKIFVTITA